MAQKAESLNFEESHARLAAVVPLQSEKRGKKAETPAAKVKRQIETTYRSLQASSARAYSVLGSKSIALASNVACRIKRVRDEKPLYIVGALAGTAFALGMVFRIWRSRHE